MSEQTAALPVGAPWAVGQVREVLFHLSTTDVTVECLVTDQRAIFGRTEWQIIPVAGHGTAWVTEGGATVGGTPYVKRRDERKAKP